MSVKRKALATAMKKTFGIWKPTHLGITELLLVAAIIHMTTAFGG